MRKYDVNEIDQMRSDISRYHAFNRESGYDLENELRTYLMASTPPDELKARADKAEADLAKRSAEHDLKARERRDRIEEIRQLVEHALNQRGVPGAVRPPSNGWGRDTCADVNSAAVVRYADAQKRSNAFMRALFGP